MSRSTRLLPILAVMVLVVAGCGDDDTTSAGPTFSGPRVTTTTRTTSTTRATTSTSALSTTTTAMAPTTTAAPATTAAPTTTAQPPTTTAPPPPPTTVPSPGGDNRVYVLGDSTLLGAKETVPAALVGWVVTYDAVGSRRLPQGIEVLRARRAEIGRVVVIQQGNNYIAAEGSYADQIDQAMTVLAGVEKVVWLTVAEKWPSRVEINAAIRAAPGRWPRIVVAEWGPMIAAHPEYADDMLHLTPTGRQAIAQLIAGHVGPP